MEIATSPMPEEKTEEQNIIGEKTNPTLALFGHLYDVDSIIVGILHILIWILIWRASGMHRLLFTRKDKPYDAVFTGIFWTYILYTFVNITSSDHTSGGVVYELNILLTVEQMISILFGTLVLFMLFHEKIDTHANCKAVIFKLSVSIVVILTTASLWVNVWTTGRAFRAVRKFKQGIYNIALGLFAIIGLLYIRASCPTT